MKTPDFAFLEEYKWLDKLCREMYCSEKGVTSYIEDMQSKPSHEVSKIPEWQGDLRELKRLRHIRNKLSHEVGTLDADMCTPSDVAWLSEFRERIINGNDPLAKWRKRRARSAQVVQRKPTAAVQVQKRRIAYDRIIIAAIILAAIIAIIAIILK